MTSADDGLSSRVRYIILTTTQYSFSPLPSSSSYFYFTIIRPPLTTDTTTTTAQKQQYYSYNPLSFFNTNAVPISYALGSPGTSGTKNDNLIWDLHVQSQAVAVFID